MDTKWRGWTTRRAVKICCAALIPVMALVFLCGGLSFARGEFWAEYNGEYSGELLFANFDDGAYFYNVYMPRTYRTVLKVAAMRGEEHILDSEFHAARDLLASTPGLYYYCERDGETATNLADTRDMSADFFRSHPVYFIQTDDWQAEIGGGGSSRFNLADGGATVYIAFSAQAVAERNSVWEAAQSYAGSHLALMGAALAIAFALLLILMAGAGRAYGAEGAAIRFTPLDMPWLDAGLAVLAGYEIAVCALAFMIADTAFNYNNLRWLFALCIALPLFAVPPLLWWILSFTKRVKAGKFWRHTLCYALLHWCCVKIRGLLRSLWAGFPLTGKVLLAGLALFFVTAFCALVDDAGIAMLACLFVTAFAVIRMLRFARRLRLVKEAAIAACDGRRDNTTRVTGGELGAIADSVSRISEAIETAVAERLKSERFKTELITNVSHDIRTPLTSMITYADLLKSEGLNSPAAPGYLDVLIQKTARLKTLTDDLFEASKAASGNVAVNIAELDLVDLVRQVLGELDGRVRSSGLDFRLNLPEHARVMADGRLMWRVMENLLSNVFKYALKGSRVYIDIAADGGSGGDGGKTGNAGSFRLDVKNISACALNVDPSGLTERFVRGDGARSGEGGSGLGLSIAQSFVQSQSGEFRLAIDGDLFKASVILPQTQEKQSK